MDLELLYVQLASLIYTLVSGPSNSSLLASYTTVSYVHNYGTHATFRIALLVYQCEITSVFLYKNV